MSTPDPRRAKDLARIHLAAKELGLDEATYRELLQSLTGRSSAGDLDARQRWQVLQELGRLQGKTAQPAPARDGAKAPLVGRLLREAYAAEWDQPQAPGPFDGSEAARRARLRARVVAWLQQHYPHIHGTPKQLEDWPLEALQACLEHIKGKVGATRRWGRR